MSEMEEKLNSVLNNPQMIQQIMAMAQSMGAQSQQKSDSPPQKHDDFPEIDLGMLQKLSGFASQSGIDKDQKTLLKALGPYLSRERLGKLEKAMRAAKLARLASGFIGSGALKL
jgi:hypothetical protein